MKPMVHLVVLGAGMIGRSIAFWAGREGWDVVIVDPVGFTPITSNGQNPKIDYVQYDGFAYVRDHIFAKDTYFVNTMPVYDLVKVLDLVYHIQLHGCHYLDISEDLPCSTMIRNEFLDHQGTLIAPHCGLAPGLTTVVAVDMMKKFETVDNVRINVGALPVDVDNDFGYVPTWSPEGLVNEYTNDNQTLIDGEIVVRDPDFLNVDPIIIRGIQYETCPTSGGLGTLVSTVDRNNRLDTHHYVKNIEYRTIRYPGHWEVIDSYLGNHEYPNPHPDIVKEQKLRLKNDLMACMTDQDQMDRVIIHIEVVGTKGKKKVTNRFTRIVDGISPLLAIQTTTALGPLFVIESHARKLLPSRYLPQEDIILTDGIRNSKFFYLDTRPSVLVDMGHHAHGLINGA